MKRCDIHFLWRLELTLYDILIKKTLDIATEHALIRLGIG